MYDCENLNGDRVQSICFLSDDFSEETLPNDVIISPEGLKNARQINEWVKDLKSSPKVFATTSLFLLRELYIEGADVRYVNLKDGVQIASDNVEDIGDIEILDRDSIQSEKYINLEYTK
jgi:hypothetical protein